MRSQKLGNGIHHRDLVVRIRSKVVLRVVELDACGCERLEIPLEHSGGEEARRRNSPRVTAHTFVVAEEKESVPQDGPTKGCAKDVLCIRVLRRDREVVVIS